jgi:hypothetical protein
MGRIENPDLNDYGASLGWHGTSSIRAKWRSLSSARASTLKKDLTQSGIVRDAMFRQLSEQLAYGRNHLLPFGLAMYVGCGFGFSLRRLCGLIGQLKPTGMRRNTHSRNAKRPQWNNPVFSFRFIGRKYKSKKTPRPRKESIVVNRRLHSEPCRECKGDSSPVDLLAYNPFRLRVSGPG